MSQNWSWVEFINVVAKDEDIALQWCIDQGLLPSTKRCPSHKTDMKMSTKRQSGLGLFRCGKNGHKNGREYSMSIAKGTFFEDARITLQKIMLFLFCFADGLDYEQTIRKTSLADKVTSSSTVADWFGKIRECLTTIVLEKQESKGPIGGEGVVVQIHEAKIGPRRYNRGRQVEGHCVFGAIDANTNEFRAMICPENKRDWVTLRELMVKHILPGTIIVINSTYNTVNHSDTLFHFLAEDDVNNTQKIESYPFKNWKRKRFADDKHSGDALIEYMWRRQLTKNKSNVFDNLIECIKQLYPIK